MKLSLKDELTISVALGSVRSAAGNLETVRDTDEAKKALRDLRMEILAALDLINDAELRTRMEALSANQAHQIYHKEPV